MVSTFEQFCESSREALRNDNGPEGRKKVQQHLEELLDSPEFIEAECDRMRTPVFVPFSATKKRDLMSWFMSMKAEKRVHHMTTAAAGQFMVRPPSGPI